MNKYLQGKQEDFEKAIEFFQKDIATLRTGRANPAILDGIMVEVYGSKMPISGLATINVSEARSIVIAPWDKSSLKEIEKAVTAANLGVSAVNEGGRVRVTVPQLTEENRRELVKKLNEKMEEARIALRQVREEAKNEVGQAFDDKEVSEDDKFRFIKELDEEVVKLNAELKAIRDKKEGEIMTI